MESERENTLDTFVRDKRTQMEWSAPFLLHTWTSQESSCLVIALSLAFAGFCFFIFRHICTGKYLLCFTFVYLLCSYNLFTSICHGIRSYIWVEFCSLLFKKYKANVLKCVPALFTSQSASCKQWFDIFLKQFMILIPSETYILL